MSDNRLLSFIDIGTTKYEVYDDSIHKLVPTPTEQEKSLFLSGNGKWSSPSVSTATLEGVLNDVDISNLAKFVTNLSSGKIEIDTLTAADIFAQNLQTSSIYTEFIKGTVGEFGYANIVKANIKTLEADLINAKFLSAENLKAGIANIDTLTTDDAFITHLTTDIINSNYIAANVAAIQTLSADSAFIQYLQSAKISAGIINAGIAGIGTAQVGTLTSKVVATDQFSSQVSTSVNSVVNFEFVRDLIATNITTQRLFVGKAILGSADQGQVVLTGNLLQFISNPGTEDELVYIQLGMDTTGDASFVLRNPKYSEDKNKSIILDVNGLHEGAFNSVDNVIRSDMLKSPEGDYMGIDAGKLNLAQLGYTSEGKMSVANVYFDDDRGALVEQLATMSTEINNSANKIRFTVKIESSEGTTINITTILTAKVYFYGTENELTNEELADNEVQYEWYCDGVIIPNETTNTYNVEFNSKDIAHDYTCKILYKDVVPVQDLNVKTDNKTKS